ncbi:MAG: magnesium-translocating P-type ATPase [Phycisphaerae bacterium]|nr:magnesium-translocating P-type ATPase [Phycisphaerae bacterium]
MATGEHRSKFVSLHPRPVGLPSEFPRPTYSIHVSPLLIEVSALSVDAAYQRLKTSSDGLTNDEAEHRLSECGLNVVEGDGRKSSWVLLWHAVFNPLVILLLMLAIISFATGDASAGVVMSLMIALGVSLRIIQEAKADYAAAKLKSMLSATAAVIRQGRSEERAVSHIAPGDLIRLAAGDMIPADVRILSAKDLFVIQGALTGESIPIEKFDADKGGAGRSPLELDNIAFLGTSVHSGSALAVVVATGRQTYLGSMAASFDTTPAPTAFDRGVSRFTWLMLRLVFVMVPLVFVINGLTKGNWREAFFFSLAVAVGLTPEMLPMIVSVCLSKGAQAMSRKKVIVKRINAIQNIGAIDILCTDKTGTLTMDRVILERHCDAALEENDEVLALAYMNSHFQTGLRNVLDRAVLAHEETHAHARIPDHAKVDEIPFDFERRMMSVVIRTPEGKDRIIGKGAPEAIFPRCRYFELDGETNPLNDLLLDDLKEEYERLSADGFRVLAIAYRDRDPKPDGEAYGKDDESDMVLKGYVAFLDPPKESAAAAIRALQNHGVAIKVVTGDNELVARKICHEVGIPTEHALVGGQVEEMTDEQLAVAAESTTLFARVSPAHKKRIIQALQAGNHTVGFLGDGINDAPALRSADVGVSVDAAVDIARESADMILLEKSLLVLDEGVLEGRRVFANILKYIGMGASSNFGNMFSVLGASLFVPYLPMTPIQILTNNLLYDLSQTAIPTDEVDAEQIARPRPWDIGSIWRFIVLIGPCSSIFDYLTFFMMLNVFHCWALDRASVFQTGWFVESLLTQTLIIYVIRTRKIPFLQSRASWPLMVTTTCIMAVGLAIPFSVIGPHLGFTHLPPLYWLLLSGITVGYLLLTQSVKTWLVRRQWI